MAVLRFEPPWRLRLNVSLDSLESAYKTSYYCSVNWTFLVGVTAKGLRAIIGSKSAISLQRGPLDPIFQVKGSPHTIATLVPNGRDGACHWQWRIEWGTTELWLPITIERFFNVRFLTSFRANLESIIYLSNQTMTLLCSYAAFVDLSN